MKVLIKFLLVFLFLINFVHLSKKVSSKKKKLQKSNTNNKAKDTLQSTIKLRTNNPNSKHKQEYKDIDNKDKTKFNIENEPFVHIISWFIFVPSVLLIIIMTILSIVGFILLLMNTTSSKGDSIRGQLFSAMKA